MIYSADADIGFSGQQFLQGQLNTIGWSSAATVLNRSISFLIKNDPFGIQCIVQSNGVSHTRLWTIWGNHHNLSNFAHITHQGAKSGSGYSIVISDQNQWFRHSVYFMGQKYVLIRYCRSRDGCIVRLKTACFPAFFNSFQPSVY